MQWRVILWRGALLVVIGCVAVLVVRLVAAPPAPAAAQSAEEQADAPQQPGVNALTPMGYTSSLGYLSVGRRTTIIGGTTEGVHVYELEKYGTEYEVSDATEGAENANDER